MSLQVSHNVARQALPTSHHAPTPELTDAEMSDFEIPLHKQETSLASSKTAEGIARINACLEKHADAIAENEAMVTNTGNKVENLEQQVDSIERSLERAGQVEYKLHRGQRLAMRMINELSDDLDDASQIKDRESDRARVALHKDGMAQMVEKLSVENTSLKQQLDAQNAQNAAFEQRLAHLESTGFRNMCSETVKKMGEMEV
ncbi:hypothetical protein ACHAPJ_004992 [Fusarium lateritium]